MLYHKQGEKLRDARERSGFTQQQIATALNIDRSTYASYEIGRSQPTPATLVILAKILNTSIESLLDDELANAYVQDIGRDKFMPRTQTYVGDSSHYASLLPRGSHIYDLSKDERAILCLYRAASKELRRKMIDQVSSMLHEEEEESKTAETK